MFLKYFNFLLGFYCVNCVLSSPILPKCKGEDNACIEKFLENLLPKILENIPELETESVDPLSIEKIEGKFPDLYYILLNTTTTGIKNCVPSNIKVNSDLTRLHYDVFCPTIYTEGEYEMKGQLITFPIEGKGDYSLTLGEQEVIIDSEIKQFVGKDGKTHLSLENYKVECHSLSSSKFDFKNLYNGNKELSDAAHKYVHENWQEVQAFVQNPLWYRYTVSVLQQANKQFNKVAIEDMTNE